MHLTTLHACALVALSCMSFPIMALPTDRSPAANMVSRHVTAAHESPATVHVNRNLHFTSSPEGTGTTKLSRREITFTPGGRDDYCSETTPDESFGPDAPLAADCLAIKDYMETIDGHFTVQPGDFHTGDEGWAVVASSGTCAFGIRFQLAANTRQVVIGTNDVHFYVNGWVRDARDGRIRAVGNISCNNDQQLLYLYWGMIHS